MEDNKNYINIETLEIAGFVGVFRALRLPFGKEARSVVESKHTVDKKYPPTYGSRVMATLDPKDIILLSTLVQRGDEHAKAIRGLIVYAEIEAPVYFWAEMETYRAGHERLASESTMHIDCKGLSGDDLVNAKAAIPMGKRLRKADFYSYQALRNMVKQRHNHRLPHWHEFVKWIWTLPYADELIFVGTGLKQEDYV